MGELPHQRGNLALKLQRFNIFATKGQFPKKGGRSISLSSGNLAVQIAHRRFNIRKKATS